MRNDHRSGHDMNAAETGAPKGAHGSENLLMIAALLLANAVESLAVLRRCGMWQDSPDEMAGKASSYRKRNGFRSMSGETMDVFRDERMFWASKAPEMLFEWCESVLGGFRVDRARITAAAVRMAEAGPRHENFHGATALMRKR